MPYSGSFANLRRATTELCTRDCQLSLFSAMLTSQCQWHRWSILPRWILDPLVIVMDGYQFEQQIDENMSALRVRFQVRQIKPAQLAFGCAIICPHLLTYLPSLWVGYTLLSQISVKSFYQRKSTIIMCEKCHSFAVWRSLQCVLRPTHPPTLS